MRGLIAFSCLLALASAGYAPLALTPEARLFDPVAIAAGAPLPTGDTYEVAAAKAAHLQAHAAAKGLAVAAPIAAPALAYNGYGGPLAAPALAYNGYAHAAPLALASEARQVDPVAIAAGAPLPTGDTVEVAAAKAAHFQAHAAAKGLAVAAPIAAPALAYNGYGGPLAAPALAYNGYGGPLAAPALAYNGYGGQFAAPALAYNGAPLPVQDTYEVAAAKAAHFQAHAAAKAGHYLHKRSPGYLNAGVVAAPLAYAAPLTLATRGFGYSTIAAAPLAYSGLPYYG